MKEVRELRELSLERKDKLAIGRKIISVLLTVSFFAMASSGFLMLMNKGFAFQLKMHPVHNTFGILMVLLGGIHVILNLDLIKIIPSKEFDPGPGNRGPLSARFFVRGGIQPGTQSRNYTKTERN